MQKNVKFILRNLSLCDKIKAENKKSEEETPMITWNRGCNTQALLQYIKDNTADGVNLRAFKLYRKGLEVSAVFPPHKAEDAMHLYSLSKSFTSLAVGIARDMGLLDVTERMIDIFPECAPEEISENLAAMTLGDVLSMQSGHSVCHLDQMRFSSNAVKTFLAMPVVYKPGTTFVYSTGGTCVCGAAVEKRSGMKLNDFMEKHLFSKLGIQKPQVLTLADGTHTGGIGIFLPIDALFRMGMLMKNKGVYNGVRVVSEEWCDMAVQPIADNSGNGTPDWVAGYGYQFWVNHRGGFRGDGAYGQLCIILPEEDTVFALQAEAGNMQIEVERIYALLDAIESEDPSAEEALLSEAEHHYDTLPAEGEIRKACDFVPNDIELLSAKLDTENDLLRVGLETRYGVQTLLAGNGKWVDCAPMLKYCNPSINSLDPHYGWIEELHLRCAYETCGDAVKVICKHPDTPHTQVFSFERDALRISANYGDLRVREIAYK